MATADRLRVQELRIHDLEPSNEEFRRAVVDGLSASPKTLPCKFFYDAEGSRLFDAICDLPEYYPTRTELGILRAEAPAMARAIGPAARIVEFGSGSGVKIRLLLAAMEAPAVYVPVDISRDHMMEAAAGLAADFPALRITPICADYTQPFALPATPGIRSAATVGFFPGSTIGNFTPAEAVAFLARARRLLGPGSMMLVGVDVPKDAGVLEAAYDDAAGVTAAFNRNLLRRMQRELGAELEIDRFRHEARWCPDRRRVEMHLVSLSRQSITIGPERFELDRGETIHTENSYKYSVPEFRALAGRSGYLPARTWTDPAGRFSVHLLRSS